MSLQSPRRAEKRKMLFGKFCAPCWGEAEVKLDKWVLTNDLDRLMEQVDRIRDLSSYRKPRGRP